MRTCAAPSDRDVLGEYDRRTANVPLPSDKWTWGGGITAADLNGDGWIDVISALEQGLELYWGNPDLLYTSSGEEVFGAFDVSFSSGTSVADYDGDGDLDVYVTRVTGHPVPEGNPQGGRNRLLRNDGAGVFVDVTDGAGVDGCGVHHRTGESGCFRSMTSSWGDVDGDGDLDLFVGDYGFVDESDGTTQDDMLPAEPSVLYLNQGDGTFVDRSDMLPDALHDGYTYAGGFFDLDADGDLDLYTVNDFGRVAANTVLWNEGGELIHRPDASAGLDRAMTGMGLGVGDLNGDGRPDLAVPEWSNNWLLESHIDLGLWIDVSEVARYGVDRAADQRVGWGTQMGDVDNDGDLDLLTQFGFLPNDNPEVWSNPMDQPDALHLNDPTEDGYVFRDVAGSWLTADPGMTRGAILVDLNRDGWLDIAKRNLGGPSVVYLSRCGEASSLVVRLEQPGMNRFGIGAKVTVRSQGEVQTRWVMAGGTGYASSDPPEVHFGLGTAAVADAVEVRWPDGTTSRVEWVPTRQEIVLAR